MTTIPKAAKGLMRAGLARATGCNIETIRYYEKIGVMPDPPRSAKGYRVYGADHVSRLGFVMRARDLGFSLQEVRALLSLVDGGVRTCADVQSLAQGQLDKVRRKIRDLRRVETVLSETVAKCSGDRVPDCAVIDALTRDEDNLQDWPDRQEKLGDWDAAFTGARPNPGAEIQPEADFSRPRTVGQATKRRRKD